MVNLIQESKISAAMHAKNRIKTINLVENIIKETPLKRAEGANNYANLLVDIYSQRL